jgi:hypothetical protein
LTLDELRGQLRERLGQTPKLQKVVIVLYGNSPDKNNANVRNLVDLVRGQGLTLDMSEPPGDAP